METIRDTDLAWAAGIIDGEGFLMISKSPNRRGFLFRLGVNSTDGDMTPRLQQLFGGNLYVRARGKPADKLCLAWHSAGMEHAVGVVQAVLPYLWTKRLQAYEFLAAAERRRQGGYRIQHGELWDCLERHESRIKALKHESLEVLYV